MFESLPCDYPGHPQVAWNLRRQLGGKIHLFMKMSVGIWDMGFYMGICTKKWKDAWKLLFNHFLYPKTMSIEEYSLSEGVSIWATKRSLTWQSIESWLCNDGILEMVLLWGISLDTYILRAAPKDKEIKRKIKQNKVTWLMENKGKWSKFKERTWKWRTMKRK